MKTIKLYETVTLYTETELEARGKYGPYTAYHPYLGTSVLILGINDETFIFRGDGDKEIEAPLFIIKEEDIQESYPLKPAYIFIGTDKDFHQFTAIFRTKEKLEEYVATDSTAWQDREFYELGREMKMKVVIS